MIDLMDELKGKSAIARRLALAFTICCTTTSGSAGEIDAIPGQPASMRGLLMQGWGTVPPLAPAASADSEDFDANAPLGPSVIRAESHADEDDERAPSILFQPDKSGTSVVAAVQQERPASPASLADLISRSADSQSIQEPGLQPLYPETDVQPLVLPAVPASIESETMVEAETEASDSVDNMRPGESLAELLRAHRDDILKPIPTSDAYRIYQAPALSKQDNFVAPSRTPIPNTVEVPSRTASHRLLVESAPEITTEPTSMGEPESVPHDSTQHVASLKSNSRPEHPQMQTSPRVPTFVSVPPRVLCVLDEPPAPSPMPQETGEIEATPEPSNTASVVPTEPKLTPPTDIASLPVLPTPILQIPSLENAEPLAPPIPLPPPTPSVTLHTARLLELAQHALHQSQQSLLRGATHTARKHAIEAMQAVVAMRDAQDGGNLHSQQLERAFDAIRESKDFCGEFGSIDFKALTRMVDVHETTALKQQDLSVITALEATEAYLDFAKNQLVLATGGVREGSQALLLLGQVELEIARASDTHATSVAVAVQRAAVESDPYFAIGYRVLGTTLLNLGLVEEAADCLITSLQIQPTRVAYERLLDIARRLGDVDTARTCMRALEDPRMEEGNLVRTLTPQEFAATHRPLSTSVQAARSSSKSETTSAQSAPAARIGFGSLFPFGRR